MWNIFKKKTAHKVYCNRRWGYPFCLGCPHCKPHDPIDNCDTIGDCCMTVNEKPISTICVKVKE